MLYKISQEASDYDTYSGAVVCAESEKEAVKIDPSGFRLWHDGASWFQCADHEEKEKHNDCWVNNIKDVKVELIGTAEDHIKIGQIICASFNAG